MGPTIGVRPRLGSQIALERSASGFEDSVIEHEENVEVAYREPVAGGGVDDDGRCGAFQAH